eukprot:scaffold35682_cov60-Phaeocystis_antarctica.AAC.2
MRPPPLLLFAEEGRRGRILVRAVVRWKSPPSVRLGYRTARGLGTNPHAPSDLPHTLSAPSAHPLHTLFAPSAHTL